MSSHPKSSQQVAKSNSQDHITFFLHLLSGLEEVVSFLLTNGVTILRVLEELGVIEAKSPVGLVEHLFETKMNLFHHTPSSTLFHRNTEGIKLPDHVKCITGLDQTPVYKPYFKLDYLATKSPFYPNQLASIYNFPPTTGKGQTIAVIELGGGYNPTYLNSYFNSIGIKPPKIIPVSVDGAVNNPYDTSGANGEVQLDIEVIGALAPDATIVVYFATNSFKGFYDAILTALTDTVNNPSIISISWGAPEAYYSDTVMFYMNQLFKYAASKGVSVFAAAGDNGATDGLDNGRYNVDYPGSSPYVTSCGGTTLTATNGKRTSEVTWNGTGATGGGVSNIFPPPSYQKGYAKVNPDFGIKGRTVPDISSNSDPRTGYIINVDGKLTVIGGTSSSSPLYSALTARINELNNKRTGFWNEKIYTHPECFYDVKVGDNDGYSASSGFDACTGLGVADGKLIADVLK